MHIVIGNEKIVKVHVGEFGNTGHKIFLIKEISVR